MRKACVSVCLAVALVGALPTAVYADPDIVVERKQAKRLEHVGEWLTGFGTAHLLAGTPLMAMFTGQPDCHADACSDLPGLYAFTGEMLVGIGGALLAVGVPLWVVGHVRHRAVERRAPASAAGFALRF